MRAIEVMQAKKLFETGVRRIGAEQEFCLVDGNFRPSIRGLCAVFALSLLRGKEKDRPEWHCRVVSDSRYSVCAILGGVRFSVSS
jgi:hypothetical protein